MDALKLFGSILLQGLVVFLIYNILVAGIIVGLIFGGTPIFISFLKSCVLGVVLSIIWAIIKPKSRW